MRKVESFTHLHLHSSFGSIQDAVGKPIAYCEKAANIGQSALAVSEHGSCASHFAFHQAGKETDTHIIYGNEFYFVKSVYPKRKADSAHIPTPVTTTTACITSAEYYDGLFFDLLYHYLF